MTFSLFDTIILTIISIFTLLGLYKGFIQVFINLLGVIVSIILSVALYPYVKSILSDQLKNDIFASILSGSVSYLFLYTILNMINSKLLALLEPMRSNIFDRFFGLILGFIKGGVIAIILFATIVIYMNHTQNIVKIHDLSNIKNKNYPYWIKSSTTVPYLENYLKQIMKFMPSQISQINVNRNEISSPNQKTEQIDNINQNNKIIENKEDNVILEKDEEEEDTKNIINFIKNLLF
ncbi:MAG: CvpA family protein [Rickettsiales bacterium]|nr:MAG: CvpA family protein [Rickettsiales bacterium]